MKVITSGKFGDGGWKKLFLCRKCNAALEVSEDDLVARNTAMAYGGETWEPRIHYACPECETHNDVTWDISPYVRERMTEELWDRRVVVSP